MWPNLQFPGHLLAFTERNLREKLNFFYFCSVLSLKRENKGSYFQNETLVLQDQIWNF